MRSLLYDFGRGLLSLFVVLILAEGAQAQGIVESSSFHGRFSLGLSYGPGRSLANCVRVQNDEDFDIARDDCGLAEGVFLYSRDFFRSVGNQVWARGVIDLHLRTNMQRSWSDTLGEGEDALTISNHNFYVETGNFLQLGEVLWFGNRSYDYEDLWLLDLRLVDQHGPGFGVEQLKSPLGRFGAAFFRVSSSLGGPAQDTLDLRLSQIPLFEGQGKLILIQTETGAIDAKSGEKKYVPMQGQQAAFIYLWESETIVHKWAVQYGRGLFGGHDQQAYNVGRGTSLNDTGEERDPALLTRGVNISEREALKRSNSLRLADQIDLVPDDSPWSLRLGAVWERVDFGNLRYEKDGVFYSRGDMQTISYALRPAYDLSAIYGLDLQLNSVSIKQGLGLKHRNPETGIEQQDRQPIDRRLQRASLGFIIRPLAWGFAEFRSYLAYSRWNRATSRDVTTGPFRDNESGITGGITFNMWW